MEVAGVGATAVRVRLAEGADSGLAHIVQQFLEQDLAEFEAKRRRARRLRGRVAMTASDHDASVTLEFRGEEIVIFGDAEPPLDATIEGPHRALVGLLQGEGSPLLEHLRGRLRVRSSLRRPFFPLRVHRLVKLAPDPQARRRKRIRAWGAGLAGAVVLGAAALLWLR